MAGYYDSHWYRDNGELHRPDDPEVVDGLKRYARDLGFRNEHSNSKFVQIAQAQMQKEQLQLLYERVKRPKSDRR